MVFKQLGLQIHDTDIFDDIYTGFLHRHGNINILHYSQEHAES